MSIAVGACFSSCEELEKAIAEFEKQTNTTFWKRDSKTINSMMNKHSSLDNVKKELHYYSLKYTCVSGGRKHLKKCTDNSRQSKTFRQSCPVFIQFLLSHDKQYLQVKAVNFEHDHPISQTLYNAMPKVRRLDDGYKKNVRKLMDLQVNKKLLLQDILHETGKHVTLKDLSNIVAKGKKLDDFDEKSGEKHEYIPPGETLDQVADILGQNCDDYKVHFDDDNMVNEIVVEQEKEAMGESAVTQEQPMTLLLETENEQNHQILGPPEMSPHTPKSKIYFARTRKGKLKSQVLVNEIKRSVKEKNLAIAKYYDSKRKHEEELHLLRKKILQLEILEKETKFKTDGLSYIVFYFIRNQP